MSSFVKFSIILFAFTLLSSFSHAQEIGEKYENEKKIEHDEFPKAALALVDPIIRLGKRTKFFKDYQEDTYYFEIKTIYKGERISIKFFQDGSLLDIEVLRELKELPEDIQNTIQHYFQSHYKKYKLSRIQIQYNRQKEGLDIDDDEEYVEEFLQMDLEDLIIKYEIEAEIVDEENERGFFEFLFDSEGEIEQIKKIIKRADDNLLY